MQNCFSCGVLLSPEARFCSQCGVPVGNKTVCKKCSFQNIAIAKFCEKCGSPLVRKINRKSADSFPQQNTAKRVRTIKNTGISVSHIPFIGVGILIIFGIK